MGVWEFSVNEGFWLWWWGQLQRARDCNTWWTAALCQRGLSLKSLCSRREGSATHLGVLRWKEPGGIAQVSREFIHCNLPSSYKWWWWRRWGWTQRFAIIVFGAFGSPKPLKGSSWERVRGDAALYHLSVLIQLVCNLEWDVGLATQAAF